MNDHTSRRSVRGVIPATLLIVLATAPLQAQEPVKRELEAFRKEQAHQGPGRAAEGLR